MQADRQTGALDQSAAAAMDEAFEEDPDFFMDVEILQAHGIVS